MAKATGTPVSYDVTKTVETITDVPAVDGEGLPVYGEDGEPTFVVTSEDVTETVECSPLEWIAYKTDMSPKSVEQRMTNLRNPVFKMETYTLDGKPVFLTGLKEAVQNDDGTYKLDDDGEPVLRYLRNEDNTAATTTIIAEARSDKKGLVRAERKALDANGVPIIERPAYPLPTFSRGAGRQGVTEESINESLQLMATLQGITIDEVKAQQAANNAAAIKRATKES
jgi:hypothetical protein